jgi:hypothetical protein
LALQCGVFTHVRAGVKVDSTLPFSPGHIAGSCNDYLPSDSTFARFLWNVHMLAANGMYVLIDDHSNFDTTIVTNYPAWIEVRLLLLLLCCLLTFLPSGVCQHLITCCLASGRAFLPPFHALCCVPS